MIFEMRMWSSAKRRVRRVGWGPFRLSMLSFRTAFASPGCLCCGLQMGQAQQVERRRPQIGHLLNLPATHVPHFAQTARLFHPAEHLLDLLPRPLAERVALGLH